MLFCVYISLARRDFSLLFSISLFCSTIILLFYGTSFVINFNLSRRTVGHILPFRDMWYICSYFVVLLLFGLVLLLQIMSLISMTYHRTILLLLLHKLLPNNLNTLQNVTVTATNTNVNALFPDMANSSTYQHNSDMLPPRLDCLNQSYLRSSSRVSL